MSLVIYEHRGPAAIVRLNRADKRNALSRALIAELDAAFARAADDPAARCVILAADGPVFCAGMDLGELQATLQSPADESPVWDDALRLARLYDRIYSLPKPTIAAVQGPAVAGGAGLVTVCDLAVAAPAATFGYPEVRRGLVAAMVMPHLLRHVGERMARHLFLTGELIDAHAAKAAGLVNDVADDVMSRVQSLAVSLAAGGPIALARTKELLARFSRQSVSLEECARGSAEPRLGRECQDGLEAFFAKRNPPWVISDR